MHIATLAQHFLMDLEAAVAGRRRRAGTVAYYRAQFRVIASHAETWQQLETVWPRLSGSWHLAQAVKRLARWSAGRGDSVPARWLIVELPPSGMRTRVLSRHELAQILWASPTWLRWFLVGMRFTFARPGELLGASMQDLRESPAPVIEVHDFKARDRRRDGKLVRLVPVPRYMWRHFVRRRRQGIPSDSALFAGVTGTRLLAGVAQRALRRVKRGIPELAAEEIVPYTLRHTAATWATWQGVQQRVLQELLGHTQIKTTTRYQHLDVGGVWSVAESCRRPPAIGATKGRLVG